MRFCTQCRNMYYVRISDNDTNQLIYYCRNCGHVDDVLTPDNICILENKTKSTTYQHAINRYTKLDPTLPHIKTIKCPNAECASNDDDRLRDVIYIRYDDTAMKYIYICAVCDTIWKTDEQR